MSRIRSKSDHMRTLRRRRDFLSKRIADMEANGAAPNRLNFDKGEMHALEWAIDMLERPTPTADGPLIQLGED